MKSKTMLLMLCLLAASLACNLQINVSNEEPSPPAIASRSPTAVLSSPTKAATTTATATRTLRPANTATPLPHLTGLPNVLTFGGAATDTVAPPLPDFPNVLTFGGGGGGADCEREGYPQGQWAMSMLEVETGQAGSVCATIFGPEGGAIRLELISPAGDILTSPMIVYNDASKSANWSRYPGFGAPAQWSGGTLFAQINVWWPVTWPLGQWQAHVYGGDVTTDLKFWVNRKTGNAYIMARDERTDKELLPAQTQPFTHALKPNADGTVDVVGIDYPPYAPVFLLLYRIQPDYTASLVQKMGAFSDNRGALQIRMPGPLELGQTYMLIGLTDPNTPLGGGVTGCGDYPCDMFVAMP